MHVRVSLTTDNVYSDVKRLISTPYRHSERRVDSDLPCLYAADATVTCGERLAVLSCCSCYRHVWRADATVTCGERLAVLSCCSCYRHVWRATCRAFILFMLPSRVDSDLPCFHAVHATVTTHGRAHPVGSNGTTPRTDPQKA